VIEEIFPDLLGSIRGKHMGLFLLAAVLIYGYFVRRNGNPWRKVLAGCVGVFLASRIAAFALRQAILMLIGGWESAGDTGRVTLVFLMPALLYIAVPAVAFRHRWFGIERKHPMRVVSRSTQQARTDGHAR